MKYSILLDSNTKTHPIEEQEQARFIKTIIDCLDVPIEFDPNNYTSIDQKIALKDNLKKYRVSVINDLNGGIQIFFEKDLIAEWKKCKYKLKEDVAEKDPLKKLFLEMQVDFWSIFEELNEQKIQKE